MLDVRWNIVFLSLTIHSFAQMIPNKYCTAPERSVMNGRMPTSSSIRLKYAPNEKVFYDCMEGFTSSVGHRYAVYTCMAGKWTPLSTCEKIGAVPVNRPTCSEPVVANGSAHRQGDSVTFSCSPGFVHTGAQRVTCGADGTWTPPLPQCLPLSGAKVASTPTPVGEIITCKGPNNLKASMQVHGSKVDYMPGDSVSFSCEDGYRLNGSSTVTCEPDGKWSPSFPKCIHIKCPELNVPNGKPDSRRMRVNITVTVTCHAGHHLEGPGTVRCLSSGRWSNIPQCMPDAITVKKTCPVPAVDNSVSTGRAGASYRIGEAFTISCKQGFYLDGPPQVTCGSTGQWQPRLPSCLQSVERSAPPKQPGECGAPQLNNQPTIHLRDDYITQKDTVFTAGSTVKYMCQIGYVPSGGSSYRHCVEGQWTKLTLKCQRKSCGFVGEISNGHFEYTGSEFGDSATAVCDEGYDMVGHKTRRCMSSGLWDGRIPVCEVVQCPEPPSVADAVMSGAYETYTYRSVVTYRCRKGTLIGDSQLWCTKDGTWSSPAPTCKEISCPNLRHVAHAYRTGALRPPYKHRDAVTFHCTSGYVLEGSTTVSCDINGQWSSEPPECRRRGPWRGH